MTMLPPELVLTCSGLTCLKHIAEVPATKLRMWPKNAPALVWKMWERGHLNTSVISFSQHRQPTASHLQCLSRQAAFCRGKFTLTCLPYSASSPERSPSHTPPHLLALCQAMRYVKLDKWKSGHLVSHFHTDECSELLC